MTEALRSSEKAIDLYSNIRFEPGNHGDGNHIYSVIKQIGAGNLDVHDWNPEVGERTQEHSPYLLALDGLTAGYEFQSYPGNIYLWAALPERPGKINPAKKVLVIAGDQSRFSEAIVNRGNIEMLLKISQGQKDDLNSADPRTETRLLLGTSLAAELILIAASLRLKKLNRRGLLKATLGGGMLTFGTKYLNDERSNSVFRAAYSSTEEEKNRNLTIASLIGPKIIKDDWARARTAMLVLKTKDAIDVLGLPKDIAASVLMGAAHSYEAQEFLDSDAACQLAIREYFNKIQVIIKAGIWEGYGIIGDERYKENIDSLVKYIAKTDILEVTDPLNMQNGQTAQDALSKNIDFKTSFQSPRVLKAITLIPYR